jgi:hypothetical protein
MNFEEILEEARKQIREHAGSNPDKWFYANRYVYARLQLDERKTKDGLKRDLFESGVPCHYCGKPFETRVGVHIHRLDNDRGYSADNTVLMHPDCHRRHHAENPRRKRRLGSLNGTLQKGASMILEKESKEYKSRSFTFWWDFAPNFVKDSKRYASVKFVKKSTGASCTVSVKTLMRFFTDNRRTSRGGGNWGVKVLKDDPNMLAFEPPKGSKEWLFLKVAWEEME